MIEFAAFLRGVNVSGKRIIRMDLLVKEMAAIGLDDVNTFIQSGNIIFNSKLKNKIELEAKIEMQIKISFGIDTKCFVRSYEEIAKCISGHPFTNPENENGSYIAFMQCAAVTAGELNTKFDQTDEDKIYFTTAETYIQTDKFSKTKFNNSFIERNIKSPATTRKISTIRKIHGLMSGSA